MNKTEMLKLPLQKALFLLGHNNVQRLVEFGLMIFTPSCTRVKIIGGNRFEFFVIHEVYAGLLQSWNAVFGKPRNLRTHSYEAC